MEEKTFVKPNDLNTIEDVLSRKEILTLNEDKNTIIYAHARLDKTMFGSLHNIIEEDYFGNDYIRGIVNEDIMEAAEDKLADYLD